MRHHLFLHGFVHLGRFELLLILQLLILQMFHFLLENPQLLHQALKSTAGMNTDYFSALIIRALSQKQALEFECVCACVSRSELVSETKEFIRGFPNRTVCEGSASS